MGLKRISDETLSPFIGVTKSSHIDSMLRGVLVGRGGDVGVISTGENSW